MQLSPVIPQRLSTIVIPQDRPVYRIKEGKFFGPDDHLYLEGEIIAWDEEPNLEMEPMNSMAQENYKKFLMKLDECGRKVAEKTGNSYTSYLDAHQNSITMAQQDSKRVQVIGAPEMVPLMGGQKNLKSKPEKIEASGDAPQMTAQGKFSLNKKGKEAVNKADGTI